MIPNLFDFRNTTHQVGQQWAPDQGSLTLQKKLKAPKIEAVWPCELIMNIDIEFVRGADEVYTQPMTPEAPSIFVDDNFPGFRSVGHNPLSSVSAMPSSYQCLLKFNQLSTIGFDIWTH